MTIPLWQATVIVGWTLDGAAYCAYHAPDGYTIGGQAIDPAPVFLSDVQPGELTCEEYTIETGRPCGADLAEPWAAEEWELPAYDFAYRALRDDIALSEPFADERFTDNNPERT